MKIINFSCLKRYRSATRRVWFTFFMASHVIAWGGLLHVWVPTTKSG